MNLRRTMSPGLPGLSRAMMAALAFGLAAGMVTPPALAQLKPALQLWIEKPNPEPGDCGAAESPIHSVATLTLENSGVRVVREGPMYLYIHPIVLQDGTGCFVNLDVSVRTRREVGPMGGFKPRDGWVGVLLCSATVAGIVAKEELVSSLMNQLVQQIKLCLESLEF